VAGDLTREDLVGALAAGHRPREARGLGLEYEQFVTDAEGRPVPYSGPAGVEALLRRAAELTGWRPLEEGGRVLGLASGDGRSITLEPGAQVEFASGICPDVPALAAQVEAYCELLRTLEDEFGVRFLALGAQPVAAPRQIERIPKARYDVLEPHLAGAGELGLWMMKATCGLQVNLDHEDEEHAMAMLRVALGLAPVLNALYANSPVRAGEWSGYASWRGHVWTRTDPSRCGLPAACLRPDSRLADYVEWALDAALLFVERDGRLVDLRGRSFRDYWRDGAGGCAATLEDWRLHLSTLFPEARFRPQLELRSLDSQPPSLALALAALGAGLFYDRGSLAAAWELVADWSMAERLQALNAAHRQGLAAAGPRGGRLLDLARELLALLRPEPADAPYLEPLRALVEYGQSNGECLAVRFRRDWGGDPAMLVAASECVPR